LPLPTHLVFALLGLGVGVAIDFSGKPKWLDNFDYQQFASDAVYSLRSSFYSSIPFGWPLLQIVVFATFVTNATSCIAIIVQIRS
jgi:hypothetical protein